ncbi:MAG: hypothetical protein IPF79_09190 [Ignavibacteria bacterium]|nr:hypothetical protein [Ignavibacteria bacterium]
MTHRTMTMILATVMLMFGGVNGWGQETWVRTFGGSGREEGHSITTTSDNGVLITGSTSSNNGDFEGMNKGEADIFVSKLNRDGEVLWKKTFGGEGIERGSFHHYYIR